MYQQSMVLALNLAVPNIFSEPSPDQSGHHSWLSHERRRHLFDGFNPALVPFKVREPELHQARLAGTQNFTRTTNLKVFFGNKETILAVSERL